MSYGFCLFILVFCFYFINFSFFSSTCLWNYKYPSWVILPTTQIFVLYPSSAFSPENKTQNQRVSRKKIFYQNHINLAITDFFNSSICVLIWQVFNSYYEYSTMLCSWEAYELRIIIYWGCKNTSYTFLIHRKPTIRQTIHSVTICYKIEACLKYFWSNLYLFFKYKKNLFSPPRP